MSDVKRLLGDSREIGSGDRIFEDKKKYSSAAHKMSSTAITMGLKLRNPQIVYYPGQQIDGTVTIKLIHENQAYDMIIRLLGKSECKYRSHGKNREKERIIMEHGKTVSTPISGKQDIDFQFILPYKIPGSIDLELGSISYQLLVRYGNNVISRPITVVVPDQFIDNKPLQQATNSSCDQFCKTLVVTNQWVTEQNDEVRSFALCTETETEVSSCVWFLRGSIGMNLSLRKSFYIPGEGIVVRVGAFNNVNVKTGRIQVSLIQTIKYITPDHIKAVKKNIVSELGPSIERNGGSDQWESEPLRIGMIAPTTSDDVISVSYDVKLKCVVRFGPAVKLLLPVVIGSVRNLNEIGERRARNRQLQSIEL